MTRHRGHVALTVWPIAVLLLLETVRLWPALGGATAFAVRSPDTWMSLFARTALVLAFFPGLWTDVDASVDDAPVASDLPRTPIADPAGLDDRRAAMGLPPHSVYLAQLRSLLGVPDDAPPFPE